MEADILDSFRPIALADIAQAKLMNRVDTKFVASTGALLNLLEWATGGYRVLEIEGLRQMPYYTRYFDTEATEMYYEHQRGRKARQKIRIRSYEGTSGGSFLEIKDKNNKGRTQKTRTRIDAVEAPLEPFAPFIAEHSHYTLPHLVAQIENHFHRITLVRDDLNERVTIDTDLCFHNLATGRQAGMSHIAIIEWKRAGASQQSAMSARLRLLGIHSTGFSKYCVGMALTNPALNQNRLKQRLRAVEKIETFQQFQILPRPWT